MYNLYAQEVRRAAMGCLPMPASHNEQDGRHAGHAVQDWAKTDENLRGMIPMNDLMRRTWWA
jgi:hypothetical protein